MLLLRPGTFPRQVDAITYAAPNVLAHAAPCVPRANGQASLSAAPRAGRSRIATLRQQGSLKLLFPRPTGEALQAVLVNTAGGVTAGDRFTLDARAEPGAALTLTTQAAERAYRAQGPEPGRIETRLCAAPRARLTWLPQETILFEGCDLRRRLTVDLDRTSDLLLCEPLVFGRTAMGEVLRAATFDERIEVNRAGAPLFLDAMHLCGDIAAHLARPFTGNGAGAMATVLLVRADAEAHLAPLRAMLPESGGASLLAPDVLILRLLAPDGFELRRSLMPVLRRLLNADLPRPWMI